MIDTDKYKTKKNRNWELKVTEGTILYEDIIAVDSLGKESYTVAQMVDTGLEDAQLIADAPLLLAKVKQAREIVPKLSRLIGVEIPWIQDDYPMLNDIFVGKTIEWNYDDSGEWVLVNHNESRWVTMSYIEVYNVSEYREQVGLKEVKE